LQTFPLNESVYRGTREIVKEKLEGRADYLVALCEDLPQPPFTLDADMVCFRIEIWALSGTCPACLEQYVDVQFLFYHFLLNWGGGIVLYLVIPNSSAVARTMSLRLRFWGRLVWSSRRTFGDNIDENNEMGRLDVPSVNST
jgi:hypothetical protein